MNLATTLNKLPPKQCAKFLTMVFKRLQLGQIDEPTRTLTAPTQAWMLPQGDIQINPYVTPPIKQRVPLPTTIIQWITDAPPIMKAPNPTQKQRLKLTKRTHSICTRNNIPGSVPAITPTAPRPFIPYPPTPTIVAPRRSPQTATPATPPPVATQIPRIRFRPIEGGVRNKIFISQEAINFLTECVWANSPDVCTPAKLKPKSTPSCLDLQQIAMPMVHPTTGETISSYKCLMHDPDTSEVWQTAFDKDFGGMAQGDNKTGQKGTNFIFVMTHDEIQTIPKNQTVTYARIVVDFHPQKADPHCIRITAGGNLINYPGELSTRTADLTTSKLMWKSILSTAGTKYVCLDIKNFYLTAPLDRFEYTKIPIALFPEWVVKQYKLMKHVLNGFIYLEMQRAVWGLPQTGILANKLLRQHLLPHDYYECNNTPGLWKHETRPISFTLVVDNFGVKYVGKEHVEHLI